MGIKDFYEKIKKTAVQGITLLFFVVGVIGLLVANFLLEKTDVLHDILNTVSTTALSAGFFSAALKSYQFMGIFKHEILMLFQDRKFFDVIKENIYCSPASKDNFIDGSMHLLQKSFQKVIENQNSSIDNSFSEQLTWAARNVLISAVRDYYIEDHERDIVIESYDEKTNEVRIKDKLILKLVPVDGEHIKYKSSVTGKSIINVEYLNVDGVSQSCCVKTSDDKCCINIDLQLAGRKKHTLSRSYTRTCQMDDDPYIHVRFNRAVQRFSVNIENKISNKIKFYLMPSGFDSDAWLSESESSRYTVHKPNLTQESSGYMLNFYKS